MAGRRHRRWLDFLLVALGSLGLMLFLALYNRAFPSAALDLALSREQIAALATEYMADLGYDLRGYETALTFEDAWLASVYLQRTLGIPGTNELAREGAVPLWFWQMRWFKPFQKEEFRLSLMPDGTLVAMGHDLLEDAPGADLPQEEAQGLAEAYLAEDRGWVLADWELVTASSQARPGGRTDHHFEWKQVAWAVGDSEMRLAVDVQGDRVDGYGHWLQVPEAFQRAYAEQRNRAGFINNLAYYLGAGGFSLVALLFFFLGHRRGIFPWHEGLQAGLLVGTVSLAAGLNTLPLSKAWYSTTQDYAVFWINQLLAVALNSMLIAGVIMVLWAGGRYLARRVWPLQDRILPRSDDRWIALGGCTWRGLMVAGLHSGYLVLFYLLATRIFGGWTPMGRADVNLYATPLPALAALEGGVVPAVSEELVARLVGIGAVLALTRRKWLALLIPGVLWAFAHLAYVRDPIYLRGVELTVVALLYGVVFLRFGLATTIVAHLTYNAGLTALPLLRAGQPALVANGVLVVIVLVSPLLLGAIRLLRRRLGDRPTPATPAIRPAGEGDLPGLERLDAGQAWAAWLADPAAVVRCLYTGDELIGAAAGCLEGEVGRVSALHVAPGWRRRYWGSHLAQALEAALKERGARWWEVTVPSGAWPLARFWDALGWEVSRLTYSRAPESRRRGQQSEAGVAAGSTTGCGRAGCLRWLRSRRTERGYGKGGDGMSDAIGTLLNARYRLEAEIGAGEAGLMGKSV
jgi:ribosomal protein S18 acetylase RimI-like enzyme